MMKELRGTRQDFDTRKKYKFKGDIITEIKKRRSGAKRVRVFFYFFLYFFRSSCFYFFLFWIGISQVKTSQVLA